MFGSLWTQLRRAGNAYLDVVYIVQSTESTVGKSDPFDYIE